MSSFIKVCETGDLKSAKEIYDEVIDRKTRLTSFIRACHGGHLEVAKWVYSLGKVNPHTGDEFPFRTACQNGRLEVAKWLWSLGGVDHHADNDFVFYYSSGGIEMEEWLESLEDVY